MTIAPTFLLACFLTGAPTQGAREPELRDPLPVGMNLRMVGPRSREWVFVDAMKSASAWRYADRPAASRHGSRAGHRPPRPGSGGERPASPQERRAQRRAAREASLAPTDPRGWPRPEPGRAVVCAMMAEQDGRYPRGRWVCTWEGQARLAFEGAARVVERQDHRWVLDVTPEKGEIVLRVQDVDPEDPIRNIRVWMPGFENAESPFHPRFLERLRPFSVIRFYPWMRPFSSSGRWDRRPRPEDARQSGDDGVAVEYMVALCNELGAEPWFTIPHTADETYVREFAKQVRDGLHAEAKVWVELSNELWNSSFPQSRWMREEAQRRGIPTARVIADEAARVFRIWREVFGDDANRVVRVAAGQLHNPGVARTLCRGLGDEVDAIAVGAYFGARPERPERPGRGGAAPRRDPGPAGGVAPAASPDELMAAARENLETVVLQRIREHRELADRVGERLGRHIRLVAYEGGQHLVAQHAGGRTGLSPRAVQEVQDHPGMYEAYRRLIEGGQRAGLELLCAYDFVGQRTPADTFGHLRFLDEPLSTAPKFRALVQDWLDR